jgi:hypothetical protein
LGLWRCAGRDAVQDCGSDLQLGNLPFEVARHDAFPEQLEASDLCLEQAASVTPAPSIARQMTAQALRAAIVGWQPRGS